MGGVVLVKKGEKFFKGISDRERCIFEGGIKLATAYHQFVGTPVSSHSKEFLEMAIEESVKNQPHVEEVKVKIREDLQEASAEHNYVPLDAKMLDIAVTTKYGKFTCRSRMRYMEDLDYPLMYIESVEEV